MQVHKTLTTGDSPRRYNSLVFAHGGLAGSSGDIVSATTTGELSEADWAASIVHGRAAFPAYQHEKTHGVPVALLHLRAHHPAHLDQAAHVATHAAAALGMPCSRPASLPTKRTLWTVPRSPFVHKKSQENFERRVHKRVLKVWDTHPDVVSTWVKFLHEHSVPGVGMRVVRWERAPLSIGKMAMDKLQAGSRSAEKVKALGEKIVEKELASPKAHTSEPVVA
jgi:small subunit ribosomal protein S10